MIAYSSMHCMHERLNWPKQNAGSATAARNSPACAARQGGMPDFSSLDPLASGAVEGKALPVAAAATPPAAPAAAPTAQPGGYAAAPRSAAPVPLTLLAGFAFSAIECYLLVFIFLRGEDKAIS